MAQGFTPIVEFYGANAALLNQRLMHWSHTDAAGIESDRLELTLNIEGLEGLPSLSGKIGLRVGYQESGLVEKGEFVITQRTPVLFPMRLMIVATAAPFSMLDASGYRQRRSASYGPTTLGALFRQLVSRHGFSPRVAPALEGIAIAHIDQSNESDMAFITRLARRYSAVTKPINALYVLAEAGQVKSLSGQLLPQVKLSVTQDNRPGDQAFITAKLDEKSRSKYMGSRVTWWDGAGGKQQVVEVGVAPFKTLRQRCQNEAEARAVAEGELRRVGREGLKLLIDCPGNPLLAAEGLLVLDETWPSYMQGQWSMKQVVHVGDPVTGYRSSITANGLSA
ncbi:phage late control D family protein [Pseudomonas sp. TH04]|jgi:phage protein D|uniref:contractile injection system protein, VgrG/Pvc8 family n=1 Tax=Pseudomonas TaxID=286 RepID=UPI00099C8E8C|nr:MULTISPECIES: contractile injection system protein, VgrG/Pvc8 family [Pseudomonas]MBK5545090.1 phage late control D family protein [Pseudomonas sp. TH04]MDD5443755.1 contractile injection system protein, VgrG/Pvc8 family [Pseudomonas fluorescens]NNB70703.1 phage late control D family protein [Pseudomonas fluorescens]OPB07482.1 phage tail protein [Pseudomonas fluorescens]